MEWKTIKMIEFWKNMWPYSIHIKRSPEREKRLYEVVANLEGKYFCMYIYLPASFSLN